MTISERFRLAAERVAKNLDGAQLEAITERVAADRAAQQSTPRYIPPYEPDTSLYSISEAAEIVKMSPDTIRRWIRQGIVPAYGRSGALRVRPADLVPRYEPAAHKRRRK